MNDMPEMLNGKAWDHANTQIEKELSTPSSIAAIFWHGPKGEELVLAITRIADGFLLATQSGPLSFSTDAYLGAYCYPEEQLGVSIVAGWELSVAPGDGLPKEFLNRLADAKREEGY